jgi:hypothetical protein
MVRPDGLLAAAPLVLHFAPDRRRRSSPASNIACGDVVEPPTTWFEVDFCCALKYA